MARYASLEEILEMDEDGLVEYVENHQNELGFDFDPEMLDGEDRIQALHNFIADHIQPELMAELHEECQLHPGCSMFPNAETEEELEEELEHYL